MVSIAVFRSGSVVRVVGIGQSGYLCLICTMSLISSVNLHFATLRHPARYPSTRVPRQGCIRPFTCESIILSLIYSFYVSITSSLL